MPCIHPTSSFWNNFLETSSNFDYLPHCLLQLTVSRFAFGTNKSTVEGSKQCGLARSGETKVSSFNTTAAWTPLAACEIPLRIQDCNFCLLSLWQFTLLLLSVSLCMYQTSHTFQSSNEKFSKIPKCNLKSVGHCSFSFLAPTVWNSLPASLQNLPNFSVLSASDFKAQLKTFPFQQAFPQM